MKRILTGAAFAAFALVIVMLLARIGALQKQIARLHRERPRAERIVVKAPAEPHVPDARQAKALPFPLTATNPADAFKLHAPEPAGTPLEVLAQDEGWQQLGEWTKFIGTRMARAHPVAEVKLVFQDLAEVGEGTFILSMDPFGGLDLTDAQRARIDIWQTQRDAEEEAARRRWEEVIKAEMTPEQHTKFTQPEAAAGSMLWAIRSATRPQPEAP